MAPTTLLKPKEYKVKDIDGVEHTYILHRFDAWEGREICTQYPLTGAPKIGNYRLNEELAQKLFCYVGVNLNGNIQPLSTRALVANHVPDWETMGNIEIAMMDYNCSFFLREKVSNFFDDTIQKIVDLIIKTSMASSEPSSTPAKPPSTN